MTRQEIEERLERVKNAEFMLQMNDHWTQEDFARDRKLNEEINELQGMLDRGEYDDERRSIEEN